MKSDYGISQGTSKSLKKILIFVATTNFLNLLPIEALVYL